MENNGKKKISLILLAVLIAIGIFYGGFQMGYSKKANAELVSPKLEQGILGDVDFSLFGDAIQTLKGNYYGIKDVSDQDILYGAIKGAVQSTGDPYTVFFPPSDAKKFEEDLSGNFGGIGAEIGMRNGELAIVAPMKDNPAERAGLKAGDKILKIDDTIASNLTVDEAVRLIRGPIGTKVKLLIARDAWKEAKEIEVVRATISVPTLDWKMVDGDIAYFQLYNFNGNAPSAFYEAAFSALVQGTKGMVLDLRNDPGGYLEVAHDLAGWFLKRGDVVVREKLRSGDENLLRANGNQAFLNLPVVVLVDGGSASASEILAGALQDQRGIKLVGEKTFGKGSVQEVEYLKDGSSMKVSIAEWLTPKGRQINKKGLDPDIEVKLSGDNTKDGKDPQYDKAMEVIKQEIGK